MEYISLGVLTMILMWVIGAIFSKLFVLRSDSDPELKSVTLGVIFIVGFISGLLWPVTIFMLTVGTIVTLILVPCYFIYYVIMRLILREKPIGLRKLFGMLLEAME